MVQPKLLRRRRRFTLLILLASSMGGMGGGMIGGCVPAYEARLRSLRERGDFSRADRLLKAAETRKPDDPAIARERGILAFEQGRHADAVPLLERALALDPDDDRAALYIAAANDRAGRWHEAEVRYRRLEALWEDSPTAGEQDSELLAALACRRQAMESRRLAELVASRLSGENASPTETAPPTENASPTETAPPAPAGRRILFLPFTASGSKAALSLRLGLAALLAADWERAPVAEPVPFMEVIAFLEALRLPLDAAIETDVRERLASLTGARYVVDGRLSELNEIVTVAAVFIDREAAGGPRTQRLEYQESRVGTFLDLEKKLIFRLIAAAGANLSPAQEAVLGEVTAGSGLAVLLYGEALRLHEEGQRAAAEERLNQALSLDPGFGPAREARLALTECQDPAGDPGALVRLYEEIGEMGAEERLQHRLLSETTRGAGRIGDLAGEGNDLSINRPLGAGSVSVPGFLPR